LKPPVAKEVHVQRSVSAPFGAPANPDDRPGAVVAISPPRPARPVGVLLNRPRLEHELRVRGLNEAEAAKVAGISAATMSHALNGHRVRPATLRKIARTLARIQPIPGAEALMAAGADQEQPEGGQQ
jgi:hypothetical protein